MMRLEELKEILGLEGISSETRAAIAEIASSQSQEDLDEDKEKAVRGILEVELDVLDLKAELSEKIADALDKFSEEGNAAAIEEMRKHSEQVNDRVGQQFKELKDFTAARIELALSS